MTPSGWLIRDGLRLAVYGAGTAGPQMVFQHGLCGDAGQISEAMAGLSPQRWTALECRGHGASDMGEISVALFADDVAALIETLPGPVVLGGISMGAAIATRLAVKRPELVKALVLVRPAWVAGDAPENIAPNAEVGALLARLPADAARKVFSQSATAARLSREAPDNLASLMGFFERAPHGATARLLCEISADGPGITKTDLRAHDLPTLICASAEDAIHPTAHAQDLAALIGGAKLVNLPPKGRDKPAHLAALA
ncbi:MAG: alpha/beta hydrolase, partial [Paracoccaceae bacterium]